MKTAKILSLYITSTWDQYLWVEDQLLLIEVQQGHGVGLRVVDEDLQAGIQGRPLTVGAAREHALEGLLGTQHRHHLRGAHRQTPSFARVMNVVCLP